MSDLVSEPVPEPLDAVNLGPPPTLEGASDGVGSCVDSSETNADLPQPMSTKSPDLERVKSEPETLKTDDSATTVDCSVIRDCLAVSSLNDSGSCPDSSASFPASSKDVGNIEPENAASLCSHNSEFSSSAGSQLPDKQTDDGQSPVTSVSAISTVSNMLPSTAPTLGEHTTTDGQTVAGIEPTEAISDTDLSACASGSVADSQNVYHVKWIKFRGSQTPIVMQNQNGPCPLLAIVNVLLLQGKIKLSSSADLVASDQLMAYIADWIFDNVPKHITEATRLNYEQNMHDAIAVFPRLQTGLDVNVKFTGISHFEYTPECVVFDLLEIPLVHGWLVDPNLKAAAEAVSTFSYNQLVERIIENKNSRNEALVTEALVAEEFLSTSASQLTYHGLCELSATLKEEQLCVLFRNNHFSTLYKHKSELFVLATDQGFLNESNVVWETLSNVEGDGHFVDAMFHTYRLPEMPSPRVAPAAVTNSAFPAPPANSKEQIDHDYLVALSLEQEQGEVTGSDVWLGSEAAVLSDHDLALKLQQEEDLSAAAVTGPVPSQSSLRQPKATSSAASNIDKPEKKSDNCTIL